jgi:hypothetical protein
MLGSLITRARALDAVLLRTPRWLQYVVVALTLLWMTLVCLSYVPRAYIDYDTVPLLAQLPQPETYGTDTIGSMYVAKVVLNDVRDMYTKEKLEQTPLERATWSKAATSPYPPATLLGFAGMYVVGERIGIGYYGIVLLFAIAFVAMSAWYFLETRWYLFPALYLNFFYFGERFTHVQDDSYLMMLVVVMAALLLARLGRPGSHALMALAIVLKLSPLAYVKSLAGMTRGTRALFVGILFCGLVLPLLIWRGYLDIFLFHQDIKGNIFDTIAAVAVVVPMTLLLWYVEARRGFDLEDRIGWALVPFAMFIGIKMRVARHLLIVLLVPDKRGPRNLIAAFGLALHLIAPDVFRLGSVLYITSVLLIATLAFHLHAIGWETMRADIEHMVRTRTLGLPSPAGAVPGK